MDVDSEENLFSNQCKIKASSLLFHVDLKIIFSRNELFFIWDCHLYEVEEMFLNDLICFLMSLILYSLSFPDDLIAAILNIFKLIMNVSLGP